MPWIRTGVFITLTLVASTLPANALSPLPTSPSQATASQNAVPQGETKNTRPPAQSDSKKNPVDPGPVMQAACQMDVSKAANTRPLGNGGPHLVVGILQNLLTAWKPSPALGQDLQSHAARVHENAHEWLTCRYPNAPPVLA